MINTNIAGCFKMNNHPIFSEKTFRYCVDKLFDNSHLWHRVAGANNVSVGSSLRTHSKWLRKLSSMTALLKLVKILPYSTYMFYMVRHWFHNDPYLKFWMMPCKRIHDVASFLNTIAPFACVMCVLCDTGPNALWGSSLQWDLSLSYQHIIARYAFCIIPDFIKGT